MSETDSTKKHTFTVMDTPTLVRINDRAIELNQNRSVVPEFIDKLDPDGTHVITFTMDHTNFEGTPGIRSQIYCKVKNSDQPVSVWIDITPEEFLALPTVNTEDIEEEIAILRKVNS